MIDSANQNIELGNKLKMEHEVLIESQMKNIQYWIDNSLFLLIQEAIENMFICTKKSTLNEAICRLIQKIDGLEIETRFSSANYENPYNS